MTDTGAEMAPPEVSSPVEVRLGGPERQRRVTVLFRLILAIPQFVVLFLVSIAAFVVVVIGWFGALFTGRLPGFAEEFLDGFLRWETRYAAYLFFVTDRYPPFSMQPSTEYPVDFRVQTGRLNRLSVLFRLVLVIPAAVVTAVLYHGLVIVSVVFWVATLVKGEPPRAFFDGAAAVIRYRARYAGFTYMLTSVYPGGLYGDGGVDEPVAALVAAPVQGPPATPALPTAVPEATATATAPVDDPSAPSIDSIPAGFRQVPPEATTPGAVPIAPPPGSGPPRPPSPVAVPSIPLAPVSGPDVALGASPAVGPVDSAAPASWSPWRLVLSSGGRTVVTVVLVVGALAYLGEIVVDATSHGSTTAVIVVPNTGGGTASGGTSGAGGSTGTSTGTGGTSGGSTGTSPGTAGTTGTSPGTAGGTGGTSGGSTGSSGGQPAVSGKGAAAKLATAWGPANDGIQAYAAAITVCAALSGQAAVQCADAADAALGQVLTTYATDLAEITFPATATTQSADALGAAQRAATVFTNIARSGTDSALQQKRSQVNITRVQTTHAALATALGS